MLWGFCTDFLNEVPTVVVQYLHRKQVEASTHCIFPILTNLRCLQKVNGDCCANSGNYS